MTKMVTIPCHPHTMNSMTNPHPTDAEIRKAAEEVLVRYGRSAIEAAARRADVLASEARWPEHATALRVLTLVEQMSGVLDENLGSHTVDDGHRHRPLDGGRSP